MKSDHIKTPISLITGALGSGKTTLLRRILRDPPARIAVLMNEFGEVAIDSKVIEGQDVRVVELAGGCVCCSLTGEFEAAVKEIIGKYHPELIVLEATGVAEADALVFEVQDNVPQVRLDSVIYLVDAYTSVKFPQVGYATRTQLEAADILLINKTDLVSAEELKMVEAAARRYNGRAMVLKTVYGEVDPQALFGLNVGGRPLPGKHSHAAGLESFVFAGHALDPRQFAQFAGELPSCVYRAKGFVCFPDRTCLFNYVMGRAELEDFPADKTELVFIGPGIEAEKQRLTHKLKRCEI